jgi:hypothetical protein
MGADGTGTLASLKSHRRELIDPGFSEHHGRIVKVPANKLNVIWLQAPLKHAMVDTIESVQSF